MTHCHEISEHSVKINPKYFQTFPKIHDVIFLVYENEANNRNFLPFQHAHQKVFKFVLELVYP